MPPLPPLPKLLPIAMLMCLLPGGSSAEEVRLGASASAVYNSNFFRAASDEEDAISFQLGPVFEISDPDGRFRYDVSYTGGYQLYVNQSGADAWESRLRARATYVIDRRTRVSLTERFRDISNLRFGREDIDDADTALDPNRQRYFRNNLELTLTHQLTRLLGMTVRTGHQWIDFEDNIDRNDSQAFDLGAELDYRLSTPHTVGIGLGYTYQDFEPALNRLGSKAQYLNAYLRWTWDVTSNVQLNLNGGPSFVHSDEDNPTTVKQDRFVGGKRNGKLERAAFSSCNLNAGSTTEADASSCSLDDDAIRADDLGGRQDFRITDDSERVGTTNEVTFFGGGSLLVDLTDWNLSAIYSRRQSSTSGDGLASSLDRVTVEAEYAPPRYRWSVFVAGSFDRRETLTEATDLDFTVVSGNGGAAERTEAFTEVQDRSSRLDAYTAITGVRTAFTPTQSVTLEFRYRRTSGRDQNFDRPDTDTFFVVLTAEYLPEVFRF